MFKIIKKGSGNFWHNFNNGSKEVNLSDWEIVLDSINQTVSLQMLNGANIPSNSVIISDVVVIDETDSSVEETFGSVEALRIRLVELNYTPYIVLNGFVPEAPIDGLTYGRKDAEWVEVSGGGSVGTLQQVTDNGNTTTNDIKVSKLYLKDSASELNGRLYLDSNNWFFEDSDGVVRFIATEGSIFLKNRTSEKEAVINTNLLTANRTYTLPDTSGTIALTSEIPTVDATPTDGSSNAVSSNGVFDGLTNKVDKNTAITGATKTKITYDSNGLVTAGADATTADIDDITTRRYVTDTQISTWNAMIGGSIFQSVWNASTNTPSLSSGVGTKGYYYIVSVDGTTNLDGISDWKVGDWAIFDGTVWRKVDNTDAISSFNGRTGAITLLNTDVTGALGFTPVSSLNSTLTGLTTLTGTTQTGSSGVGTLSLTQTWNTTGSPTAIILNVTNTASGSAARLLDLQTGGVSRFAVDKLGGMLATLITSTAEINAGLANSFTWGTTNSRATIFSPSNGVIRLSNGTGTDFSRLQFGLTSSAAPAIKRNGTTLNFRLADDSADCPITASNGTFSGNIIASGTTSIIRLKGYTVATLPSGTQGDTAFVTDALTPTSLSAVVGGGTVIVTVFYNGTNWIVQ